MSQYQTTSSQSWFSRLGGAFKGVLIGLVLFVIGFPVLWINEGDAVRNKNSLIELQNITVNVGKPEIKAENEGKPVFMTGPVATPDILTDSAFGIAENAICLKRLVEIYQYDEFEWSEEKKKMGGGTETVTTYKYTPEWLVTPIDSNGFHDPEAKSKYRNVGIMRFQNIDQTATNVSFGEFKVGPEIMNRIGECEPYHFTPDFQLPQQLKALGARIEDNYIIIPYTSPSTTTANAINQAVNTVAGTGDANAAGQAIANAAAPQNTAQIGDLRVSFSIIRPHDVSLVALQKGDTFTYYTAKNDNKHFLFQDGTHTADELFESKAASNKMKRWLGRLIGFVLMFIGLSMVLRPLSVLADVIPIIGTIVGKGTGFVAFIIAAICSLVTIAIAWVAYRPILAISLLVVAGVCVYLFISKKKAAAAQA